MPSIGPALHWSFQGDRVLFPLIAVDSFTDFIFASLMTILVCASERQALGAPLIEIIPEMCSLVENVDIQHGDFPPNLLRAYLDDISHRASPPNIFASPRCTNALYSIITVIILTLSASQFFIELQNLPKPPNSHPLTLLSRPFRSTQTRPRSRSKPDDIFIHPTESNIARADAAALELGLGGDTERVRSHLCNKEESAWEAGTGKDQVRAILAGQLKVLQPSTASEREPFLIGKDDEESEYP